jgi:hypothetical protein
MKVIKPVTIADAQLISSSVPETDYTAYSAATNYAVGARAIYAHKVWESVQTPNTGKTPGTNALYWAEIAPTNRWLMFDSEISTQTQAASTLTVVIKPGLVDSLALIGLQGAMVSITVRDGLTGPVVYTYSSALDGSVVQDWYQYFYQPFIPILSLVLTDLPLYGSAHITVSITGTGTIKCGSLIAGQSYELGDSQFGASIGIIDYSKKTTSLSGSTTFSRGKSSKRMSLQIIVKNFNLDNVFRTLDDLRATPSVWIGTTAAGYQALTIFGFYRDFSIEIAYPTESFCSLEIEGLV